MADPHRHALGVEVLADVVRVHALDIDGGDIAPMEAIMLDGGRTQPVSVTCCLALSSSA